VNNLITLLTDFGVADTYVGQMKGAIASVSAELRWVDLSHSVPAQDIRAGAFLLWTAVEAFPIWTVHLAVVDPGVGSSRRGIAARAKNGQCFVGPDNGLLAPSVDACGGLDAAVELTEPGYWGARRSSTFHGRDRFAPVAAHLARGVALEQMGRPVAALERPFFFSVPRREGKRLHGEVLHVDTYGNLITNLSAALLPAQFEVGVGTLRIQGAPQPHYQSVEPGELLALVGSAGLLEISARDSSAAARLGVGRGSPVTVFGQFVGG